MTIMVRLALGVLAAIAVAFIVSAATGEGGENELLSAVSMKKICTDKCAAFIIF